MTVSLDSSNLMPRFGPLTEVQVEFAQPSFSVSESDGSISVCVNISGASLERNVTVYVSITDGTAMCESLHECKHNNGSGVMTTHEWSSVMHGACLSQIEVVILKTQSLQYNLTSRCIELTGFKSCM